VNAIEGVLDRDLDVLRPTRHAIRLERQFYPVEPDL
jgi:hypothetical protein